jgi:hypothetical protein
MVTMSHAGEDAGVRMSYLSRDKERAMSINVGVVDKVVRIVVGVGLLSLVIVLEGNVRWLGLIGIVPLVTGLIGYCPLYSVLGLSTCLTKPSAS